MSDTDELLTVAQAAERLGTTIPRLRRLLARPEMAQHSRQEDLKTQRGTRTSTVIPVSELPALGRELQKGNAAPGIDKQEQTHLKTFSETEVRALQMTLRRTEELLGSKDKELAAKDEIIGLLKEKIEGLQRTAIPSTVQEQKQEHAETVLETPSDTQDAQKIGPGRAETSAAGKDGAEQPPAAGTASQAQKQGWWERLWKRSQNQ